MIHLYTGSGKGKTTAAAGLALRAAGRNKKVIFAQFMKGNESGEIMVLQQLPSVKVLRISQNYGFYKKMSEEQKCRITEEHNRILRQITEQMDKKECDIVVLDEITYPVQWKLLEEELVRKILQAPELEIILTGRNAPLFMQEAADYITEMNCIRHPYEKGVPAREGIEY